MPNKERKKERKKAKVTLKERLSVIQYESGNEKDVLYYIKNVCQE